MSNAKLNIDITMEELEQVEHQLRLQRHVARYRYIRRYCYGKVVDIGCGVGYGTYLISQNPDVTDIIGVDPSRDSINKACERFSAPKLKYECGYFHQCNVFRSSVATIIEVLEHIEDPEALLRQCYAAKVDRIIATVPAYKTTHFNMHHCHDFKISDFISLFRKSGYRLRDHTCHKYPWPYEIMDNPMVFGNEVFLGIFQYVSRGSRIRLQLSA